MQLLVTIIYCYCTWQTRSKLYIMVDQSEVIISQYKLGYHIDYIEKASHCSFIPELAYLTNCTLLLAIYSHPPLQVYIPSSFLFGWL